MAERTATERGPSMRLDVFLWHVRLAKTRSAAQALVAVARMRLDGRLVERAATAVRAGNILTFAAGPRVRAVRIEALPHRRGPAPEAQSCYTELVFDPAKLDVVPARSASPQYHVLGGGEGERAGAVDEKNVSQQAPLD